jgi:hypothetical protein
MASKYTGQAAYWQEQIDKYRASGHTRHDYCRAQGVSFNQLAYQIALRSKPATMNKAPFARVATVTPPSVLSKPAAARVLFGGGVILEIDAGTDPAWLAQVVTRVGRQP